MSQYYPPQGPAYPPPQQNPESDYYYDEPEYEYEELEESGNSYMQLALAFVGGGCLVFLCMSACLFMLGGLALLDSSLAGGGSAPIPGSEIGLSFTDPAFPNESVVNDQGVQATILEVNRNAVVEAIQPVEGREVIIVTIELVNLGEEDAEFNERNFMLLNDFEEAYAPTVGAVAGALGRGVLPPGEGLEGRLVFEVIAGEQNLRLLWEPARDSSPRYIYLE